MTDIFNIKTVGISIIVVLVVAIGWSLGSPHIPVYSSSSPNTQFLISIIIGAIAWWTSFYWAVTRYG